jgi:hypothetical protein
VELAAEDEDAVGGVSGWIHRGMRRKPPLDMVSLEWSGPWRAGGGRAGGRGKGRQKGSRWKRWTVESYVGLQEKLRASPAAALN